MVEESTVIGTSLVFKHIWLRMAQTAYIFIHGMDKTVRVGYYYEKGTNEDVINIANIVERRILNKNDSSSGTQQNKGYWRKVTIRDIEMCFIH